MTEKQSGTNHADKRKFRYLFFFLAAVLLLSACSGKEYETYQLGENTGSSSGAAGGISGPFGGAGPSGGGEDTGKAGGSGAGGSGTKESAADSAGEEAEGGGSIFGRRKKEKTGDEDSGGSGTDSGDDGSSGTSGDDEAPPEDGGLFPDDVFVVEEAPNTARQLTEADIQQMNNNQAVIIRSNNGYVSTLVGRYYDKKITVRPNDMRSFEEAINSLNGIATLLGLTEGTEFFATYGSQDKEGYTYLTYQQRYGAITVENATMHIVIDPEGYPCAVSCSFVPHQGIAGTSNSITPEEAISIVRSFVAQYGFTNLPVYAEATVRAAIPVYTQIHNCYVVFTDNPEGMSGFENLRYCKWFVSMDPDAEQKILMMLPTSTLTVSQETSYYPTDEYFENLEPVKWSGQVDLMNEGVRNIEITVSYNKLDGKYYMIDPARKIAVADCYEFLYGSGLEFLSSPSNTWEERDIAAMYNYEAAYDAYAKINIKAPDGFETPILLLREFCNENRQPENNACYMAQFNGWFTFCYSTINNYCYDLDVIGHEYTHAVTESCILGNNYMNDAGAINEAYSDIMGNLIEYMAGRTTDKFWYNGENSNEIARQMSDPVQYKQPDCVGGPFYVPNVDYPIQNFNDNGGVHTNSGIINYAAYLMYTAGLDYASMFDIFYTSMNILTPANSFADVYAALIYSCRSNGYTRYENAINQAFERTGVLAKDRAVQERMGSSRSGYGSMYLNVSGSSTHQYLIVLYDAYNTEEPYAYFWPDRSGTAYITVPEGYYMMQLMDLDLTTGNVGGYIYTGYGWGEQPTQDSIITVSSGHITNMEGFYG
ncbi:MAG: M4 family metallopeptidase [Lachnospiraceae bacterium]|nr:M4 family metallopeptidase [Lachnospiraceae bacterium]